MTRQRIDRECVILALSARARQAEQPEMRRVARLVGNRLRTDHSLARREVHCRVGRGAQALGALECKHVCRIRYDFGCTNRRQHLVLIGRPHRGGCSEWGDRRELDGFESLGGVEQDSIDRDGGALIDRRGRTKRSRRYCASTSFGVRAAARRRITSSSRDCSSLPGALAASCSNPAWPSTSTIHPRVTRRRYYRRARGDGVAPWSNATHARAARRVAHR